MQLFYNFCYQRSSFLASQSYLLLPVITIVYFANNRYNIFTLQVISHFLLFFFSSQILSFPHKCGIRYNNVPADVHAHYAEPLISISLQQLIPNHSGNNFRHARKLQTFCGMICGRPASIKTFKKLFAGGRIGAQETIETTIGIPL